MVVGPVVGQKDFRPTNKVLGAVPDHGEQAHTFGNKWSEKPKMVTNCSHLSNDGRNLKDSTGPSFNFISFPIKLLTVIP